MIQVGKRTVSYYQFLNYIQERYGDNIDKMQSPITETCNEKGEDIDDNTKFKPYVIKVTNTETRKSKLFKDIESVSKFINVSNHRIYEAMRLGERVKKKYIITKMDIDMIET